MSFLNNNQDFDVVYDIHTILDSFVKYMLSWILNVQPILPSTNEILSLDSMLLLGFFRIQRELHSAWMLACLRDDSVYAIAWCVLQVTLVWRLCKQHALQLRRRYLVQGYLAATCRGDPHLLCTAAAWWTRMVGFSLSISCVRHQFLGTICRDRELSALWCSFCQSPITWQTNWVWMALLCWWLFSIGAGPLDVSFCWALVY